MELLIVIEGNGNMAEAGHVIAAMPDGHGWGLGETGNPRWRIVHVPGLTDAEAAGLHATPDIVPGEATPWRRLKLDVTSLPATLTRADLYARVLS